jgi:hypothetical protein
MPTPSRRGHNVYECCPKCKKKSRAVFYNTIDGQPSIKYVTTTNSHFGYSKMVTFRDTPEMDAIYSQKGSEWMRNTLRKAVEAEGEL